MEPVKKRTMLILSGLCLFHLIINLIYFSQFEPYIHLSTNSLKEIQTFSNLNPSYLPLMFQAAESLSLSQYEISHFLFPLVKNFYGHFAFINTFLLCALIIVIFLIGKKTGNKTIGLLAAFLISFYPCIYLVSRQVHFFLCNIFLISTVILFLLYSDYFTKFSFSLAAALTALTIKYVVPTTETALSYFTLTGPIIYLFMGMTKRMKGKLSSKHFFKTLKPFFYFLIFIIIITIDFKVTCLQHIFSGDIENDNKRFSKQKTWGRIDKEKKETQLWLKIEDKFFILLEERNKTDLNSLVNTSHCLDIPKLTRFGQIMKQFGYSKNESEDDYYKRLLSFMRPLQENSLEIIEGEDFYQQQKVHGAKLIFWYKKSPAQKTKINIFINHPALSKTEEIYSKITEQGPTETNRFSIYALTLPGFDFLSRPIVALSSYWFILSLTLLRPFLFSIFFIFFLIYFKKAFQENWLFLLWILIPIFTLSFISKKQDWYIIGTIPAFALISAHFLYQTFKNKKIWLSSILFLIILDFLYISFGSDVFNFNASRLVTYFYNTPIIKTFDAITEERYISNPKKNIKALKIISALRKEKIKDGEQIYIFNDYELFKELSFYATLEKTLKANFYFLPDKNETKEYKINHKK